MDLEFVTICRPVDDVEEERRVKRRAEKWESVGDNGFVYDLSSDEETESQKDDEESDTDGAHEDDHENRCADGTCMCEKSPEDFPEWKWAISKQAVRIIRQDLMNGSWERGQYRHGVYICNDWDGYGFHELMENQVGLLGPVLSWR